MAGTGDDMGVFKGLEGDAGLSSHQDLKQQVGGDCGGTKVDSKGNDNVGDDVGGSYVFVGEANACDPVVHVENWGVVVGTRGNDGGVLAGMGKDGALHGELLVESGSVVVEGGEADRDVKVEDQVGLKDETAVRVENEELVVWNRGNDQDYAVEEDNCRLLVVTEKDVALHEDRVDFDSTTNLIENQESQTDTDIDLGERQEEVIKIMLAHELSESRIKSVEKNVLQPSEELGENVKSEAITLGADGCELTNVEAEIDVEVGKEKTEIKLVEESLEHEISVACSVNCWAHELGKDHAMLKQINDLANDAKLGESKETGIKSAEASELSDIGVRVVQRDVIVSPADSGQKSDTGVDVLPDFQISKGDTENSSKAISTMNSVGSESYADINSESGIHYGSDMPVKDASVAESKVLSGSVNDGHTTLLECSSGDSVIGETLGVVAKEKPFRFLVKIPRLDDDKLEKHMKDAQMLVEEKTTRRDDIGIEIERKRAKLQSIICKFEATKSDERAARRSVKLKRQEIDFIQDRINKLKNSISVIDINNRIQHMEHMIEHETNPLEEKNQLLREINTLRKLQDQISSNVYSDNEDNSPFTQIEPMDMQLKTLKKELGDLKAKVSNAEAGAILLAHECNGECKKLGELQAQFRAANDVRQDAYKDFLGLERQLHEKSKHYWMYKDEAKTANDYAVKGDIEALYLLCTTQVETFMDLWNKNDEFREDYVRCNMRSTLRRLKTSDGRSLGPDEEPRVIPIYMGKRDDMQMSTSSRTTHPSPAMKQENIMKPVKSEQVDGKSWVPEESKKKMLKDKASVKAIPESGSVIHIVSSPLESVEILEEKKQQTEEELESARKADMLRQEEMAAKLKEELRQEERAKAQEALERKRRNAEKAQMRAMLRAQKEAEQKDKEREKRLRKKEKKNTNEESGLEVELHTNSSMEESPDSPGTKLKISCQCSKNNKPKATAIPPALRNRGKRQLFYQIMCWILGAVTTLFVLMVMNDSSYRPVKPRTKGDRFSATNWQPI